MISTRGARLQGAIIALTLALLGGGAAGCGPGDGWRDPGPPVMTVLSPMPLDALAYRDGDGPWQPLSNAFGVYRFEIRQERYSLAFVCRSAGLGEVIHAGAYEMSMIRVPCGDPLGSYQVPAEKHRWQGAIRGAAPDAEVTVSFGTYHRPVQAAVQGGRYTVDLRPSGYDLLAVAQRPDGSARVLIHRRVEVTGPGGMDLDFEQGALIPVARPLAWPAAAAGEQLEVGVTITTEVGATAPLAATTDGQVPLLEAKDLQPGDAQDVWARGSTLPTLQLRGTSRVVSEGTPSPLELPSPVALIPGSAGLAASSPVARPGVSFQVTPGSRKDPAPSSDANTGIISRDPQLVFHQLVIAPLAPGDNLTWVVNASALWLGARTRLELPDLSAMPGFTPDWGPRAGVPMQLELTAVTSNRRLDHLLDGVGPARPGDVTSHAKVVVPLPAQTVR